jgi:hypothetical protein
MEMNQVSLYVSPTSGFTYEVVPTDKYGWFRYAILKDGQQVQFALTEDKIADQVKHYEQPGWDGWVSSRYD